MSGHPIQDSGHERYLALALQVSCHAVNRLSVEEARESIRRSIARIERQLRASLQWLGPTVRLVVLPEYVLTGYPAGDSVAGWAAKAAIDPDGVELEQLAGAAQVNRCFLAVNAYERDPNFPDLYFQCSFVLDPSGEVVLRYRRLHSLFSPTPLDVWDRYLDVYGPEAILPVARTPIGALAAIASEEILFPELARALALRGAEVFVHSTSEATGAQPGQKAVARMARSAENAAYVVSANTAGVLDSDFPASSTDGGSAVVDYGGRILAEAAAGESMIAHAQIDLAGLRAARRTPGMGNQLARVVTWMWAGEYARCELGARNGLVGKPPPAREWFAARHREAVARLIEIIG